MNLQALKMDIAATAGKRARSVLRRDFSDKEDVFFAIFEEDVSRDREQISLHLSEVPSEEESAS